MISEAKVIEALEVLGFNFGPDENTEYSVNIRLGLSRSDIEYTIAEIGKNVTHERIYIMNTDRVGEQVASLEKTSRVLQAEIRELEEFKAHELEAKEETK
ncbi:hypothetical protein ACFO6V_28040 [Promicromonospora alba]|uniref:Uncharacterized protein n=1 Tax=Promicromonospora alba TaxID=1616110 RepID=A0ABV9HRU0_9MICO